MGVLYKNATNCVTAPCTRAVAVAVAVSVAVSFAISVSVVWVGLVQLLTAVGASKKMKEITKRQNQAMKDVSGGGRE